MQKEPLYPEHVILGHTLQPQLEDLFLGIPFKKLLGKLEIWVITAKN